MEFEKKVVELDVNDVLPNRFQPRIKFNEDSINELCESIKEHGVIQPIVVRAMGDKYEIIAGERRYKASLLAGKQTIPSVITDLNDKDSAEVALIENVQRKDLTPIEEAISYKKILDMGYLTQDELATKLGKTQSTVANKLRLLNLNEDVQEAVLEEKISERHARSLLRISNLQQQKEMLDKIIENRWTVRKTDEEINSLLNGSNDSLVIENNNDNTEIPVKEIVNPFKIEPISVDEKKSVDIKEISDLDNFYDIPVVIEDNLFELPAVSEDKVLVSSPVAPLVENQLPTEIVTNLIDKSDSSFLPGFMDIDKIKEDAKDINSTIEEKNIDIDSLLKSTISSENNLEKKEIEVEEENMENKLEQGKFFSLPIDEEEEQKPLEVSKPLEVDVMSSFNFDMGNSQMAVNNQNSIEQTMPVQEQNNENFNSISLDSLMGNIQAIDNTPIVESLPTQVVEDVQAQIVETIPTPVIESTIQTPAVADEITAMLSQVQEVPLSAIENNDLIKVEENNSIPDFTFPTLEENNGTENDDMDTFIGISNKPSFVEETKEIPVVENVIVSEPSPQLEEYSLPSFEPTPATPVKVDMEFNNFDMPLSSEDMPVPTIETEQKIKKNIMDAIDVIRANTKQLETMGFVVDTEEFDFESAYQVIIKIEK